MDSTSNVSPSEQTEQRASEPPREEDALVRLRLAVEQSLDGIAVTDLDGHVQFVNAAWAHSHGFEVDELLGKHLSVFHNEEQLESDVLPFVETVKKDGVHRAEVGHAKKDGSTFQTWMSVSLLKDDCGNPIGLVANARDITDLKRAEDALQEERNRLRSIVDAMDGMDGMLTIQDRDYNIIYQNGIMERVFGGFGNKCYKIYEGRDHVCEGCPVEKAFRDGQSHTSEREVTVLGEDTNYFDNTAHPVRNAAGEITSCVEVVRNVTDRKLAEKARELLIERQSELNHLQQDLLGSGTLTEKLKRITDCVVSAFHADFCRIWIVNPSDSCESSCVHSSEDDEPYACQERNQCLWLMASSGRYTHTNGKVHRRIPFGFRMIGSVAAGTESKILINDVTTDPRIHDQDWARKLGLISFAAYQLRPPDGNTIGVLALFSKNTITPTEDALLESLGSTVAQVVQKSRAEEQLEALHRQLQETSRLAGMSEIATGVLHNVGNVLNSVNVAANLVSDKLRRSRIAELQKAADIIAENEHDMANFVTEHPQGKHLARYVIEIAKHLLAEQTDVLASMGDLRKSIEHIKEIVSRQQDYANVSGILEQVNIKELVADALRIRAVSFGRHQIDINTEFDDVPDILADRHKLMQIIINAVANAKHAISDHRSTGGALTLRLSQVEENRIRLEIADDGVGITPEDMPRIFNYGFTTKRDGHGFGLHNSALAAAELGGTLKAYSEGQGKGATFVLELPIQPETANTAT